MHLFNDIVTNCLEKFRSYYKVSYCYIKLLSLKVVDLTQERRRRKEEKEVLYPSSTNHKSVLNLPISNIN